MNDIKIASIPVPPGNTILEQMNIMRYTVGMLSIRLMISLEDLGKILDGRSPITLEIAIALERVMGLPAQFWMGLEESYRKALSEQNMFTIRCECGCVIKSNDLSIWCPDCGANYNIVTNSTPSKQERVREERE